MAYTYELSQGDDCNFLGFHHFFSLMYSLCSFQFLWNFITTIILCVFEMLSRLPHEYTWKFIIFFTDIFHASQQWVFFLAPFWFGTILFRLYYENVRIPIFWFTFSKTNKKKKTLHIVASNILLLILLFFFCCCQMNVVWLQFISETMCCVPSIFQVWYIFSTCSRSLFVFRL